MRIFRTSDNGRLVAEAVKKLAQDKPEEIPEAKPEEKPARPRSQHADAVRAMLSRRRGAHRALWAAMDEMSPEAVRDLWMILRDFEDDLRQAERTFRPFPGGPKIRM